MGKVAGRHVVNYTEMMCMEGDYESETNVHAKWIEVAEQAYLQSMYN
jgi:hypothetical protein